ncbi:acyl-CoA thioesterase [Chelatococcus reniformis]|uniref:4-hydroxybenzoyl-CoA thioesterase n=1 Tax=Chelatococcus reniformis TaxID=1494448 RepID=A0A916UJS0_9HYPH|nr:thioesterase family protein [Chelatococcus reniformis]GGC74604.1 4-hydroxybenzoyl-CoA thioesterase [Chelatococcus reniformis]
MPGFSNTRRLDIEWGHCDPAGIVFNPRFFEFFDWSTALLVEAALAMPKLAMIDAYGLVGIPLVDTRASFATPCRFGDSVEIVSTVVEVKRTSFAVRHRLLKGETLSVEGHEVRVWAGRDAAHPERLKGKAIPDDVRARLMPAET